MRARCPAYLTELALITLTRGGSLTSKNGVFFPFPPLSSFHYKPQLLNGELKENYSESKTLGIKIKVYLSFRFRTSLWRCDIYCTSDYLVQKHICRPDEVWDPGFWNTPQRCVERARKFATLRRNALQQYNKLPSRRRKTQSFWIFDQQHRSMKCSIISNHICQCNLFSTILQQS